MTCSHATLQYQYTNIVTLTLQPEPLRRQHAAAPPGERRRGSLPAQPFRVPAQEESHGVRTARRRPADVSKVCLSGDQSMNRRLNSAFER